MLIARSFIARLLIAVTDRFETSISLREMFRNEFVLKIFDNYAPGDDSPHGGILLLLCPYVCMYVCMYVRVWLKFSVKVFG